MKAKSSSVEKEEELTKVPALKVGDAEVSKSLKVSFNNKSKFQLSCVHVISHMLVGQSAHPFIINY